ncbi:anthranilate synthase component 1 [Cryobacterium mesophilum]|uniref:Anthranilate synthase component 1 n=1 Tax=Terrimesophilobacter mesophilus TaxID=433647 RepID=A0A4R8V8L7_9MICO|nr:anthranilate synthase component I [Terrimesophilobacter mesophilus]MBB5631897.1 anthranilate synthase component 1 [Terrimesophilobacter mesophilus]TFB78805.1 anthranilate synthase component I [Terrimesophilobacter mesophilus]
MTTRAEFDALLDGHRVIPVIRQLFADGETPVGIYRKLAQGVPGTFLLESAEQGGIWSRYSFIGVSSFGVLTEQDGRPLWLNGGLSSERALGQVVPDSPLAAIEHLYRRWTTPRIAGHPPLTGGLIGFVGWNAVRQIERLTAGPPADFEIPGQAFSFVRELVVMDHRTGAVLLIATVLNDGTEDADALWDGASAALDGLQSRLAAPSESGIAEVDLEEEPSARSRLGAGEFHAAVETGKQYIRDGDVFQVVLSQRFDHDVMAEPIDVYRVLRALNPSPYMYLLSLAEPGGEPYWVVGSSPEALVKVDDGRTYMHPIAGSRPRGDTPERDLDLASALAADEKERAEHLMLVDLARNDLAKVCVPGSVEVTEFMQVERFSHIMHLVSSVEGDLRTGIGPVDVLRATFPAGTLSGAPKPRALEIIDELEPAARGLYGGVVGYIGFAGDLDLAIAIRTATISRGVARVQAGAGIVADSDPDLEFEESRNKAAAPLRAVAVANRMRRVAP